MGLLPFNKTIRVNRGAYLGTASGASIPSATGKTPGDYYIITTAGGGYSIGDIAVVQVGAAGYDKISISSGVAAINGSNVTSAATWRANLDVPSTDAARRLGGFASVPGIWFDGTTSAWISSKISGQAISTGDCSLWFRVSVPSANPSSTVYIGSLIVDGNNRLFLDVDSTGVLRLFRSVSGSTSSSTLSGFVSTYAGKVVDIVVTRANVSGSAADLIVYVDETAVITASAAANGGVSFTDPTTLSVGTYSSGYSNWQGTIYRAGVFNFALSSTEVAALGRYGVAPMHEWGSRTVATSGTLVVGKRYIISSYVAGDSFTNVGAAANATGQVFTATGTTPTTWTNSTQIMRLGAMIDLDLSQGIGGHFPDRSSNRFGADASGMSGWEHVMPRRSGCFTVNRLFSHSDISSTAATTKLLDLPANCAITDVEFDRTAAFDGGITANVGVSGTATKFVNAQSLASTGIARVASSDLASQSNSASTAVYIQKSGATTVGTVRVSVTVQIRG